MRGASKMARYMMLRPNSEKENRTENRSPNYPRSEYGGGNRNEYGGEMQNNGGMQNGGYETENRFRDRRGREHYDNGRYAPKNAYYESEMRGEGGGQNEMRYNGETENRGGREGNSGGNRQGGTRSRYENTRGGYNDEEMGMRMNTIGFGNRDRPEVAYQRGANVTNAAGGEMERQSGKKEHGGAYSEEMGLTHEMAKEWTEHMKNSDGSFGAHWSMEQTKQLAQQRGITAEPIEFYAVVNAMYSDYCAVAKKHNVHNADFYVDLAKAWLADKDAVPNKAAMYYECVVKH